MSDIKLCKDCRHCRILCHKHERTAGVNPVSGREDYVGLKAPHIERSLPWFFAVIMNECGESGRFWEAK